MFRLGFVIRLAARYPKSFLAVLLALAGAGWLGKALVQRKLARETAEAPAEVVTVAQFSDPNHTYITFRYVVAGQTLTGHSDKDGQVKAAYPAGPNYKVCYDPTKPREADIYELNHQCGQ